MNTADKSRKALQRDKVDVHGKLMMEAATTSMGVSVLSTLQEANRWCVVGFASAGIVRVGGATNLLLARIRLTIALSAVMDTVPPEAPVVNTSFPIISRLRLTELTTIPSPEATRINVFMIEMCAPLPDEDEKPAPVPDVTRETSRIDSFESADHAPVTARGIIVDAAVTLVRTISARALALAADLSARKELFEKVHPATNRRKEVPMTPRSSNAAVVNTTLSKVSAEKVAVPTVDVDPPPLITELSILTIVLLRPVAENFSGPPTEALVIAKSEFTALATAVSCSRPAVAVDAVVVTPLTIILEPETAPATSSVKAPEQIELVMLIVTSESAFGASKSNFTLRVFMTLM